MEITLLADNPQDCEIIATWFFNEWGYLNNETSESLIFEKVLAKSLSRDETPLAITARVEEQVVGVVELKRYENKAYPDYEHWLCSVFVAIQHRNQGIAHKLILAAKNKAKELGICLLYLQCKKCMIPLYKRHDFVVIHSKKGDDADTNIMVAHIQGRND